MTSQRDLKPSQPPRIAEWLLALFTPADAEESIKGDLFEEFSGVVIASGHDFARSWYWRQTLKTIAHAAGSAFRDAPWLMLVTVIGGFWLIGFATRSARDAMQMYLDAHHVYELHPNAYLFWLKFPLGIGRVIICAMVGGLVALAARRIAMVAVIALALAQMVLFLVGTVALIGGGREWLHWFLVMLPWNSGGSIATIAGGVIVRVCKSKPTTSRIAAA